MYQMATGFGLNTVSTKSIILCLLIIGNYYLPDKKYLNVKFFNDLITGKKVSLKRGEGVTIVEVAKFRELSSAFVLKQCVDAGLSNYIPDHWQKPKAKIQREFLWNLLATFNPEYTAQIIEHAWKQRVPVIDTSNKLIEVEVCEEVANLLS